MSQGFSFGFSGGDDSDDETLNIASQSEPSTSASNETESINLIPPQKLDIDALLSILPSQIAYTTISITSPGGTTLRLPRRELFDIRLQLIAEDESDSPALLAGLDDADIRTNVYEGGFKTWECSLDLVALLLDSATSGKRPGTVIELGAGTALPSATVLWQYLRSRTVLAGGEAEPEGLTLTITDYNSTVLTHATLPNLLLTYASTLPAKTHPFAPENPNPLAFGSESWQENGSLEITPALVEAFKALLQHEVRITLIGGSWATESFDALLPPSAMPSNYPLNISSPVETLILASETIYSPAATRTFSSVLSRLLTRAPGARALVAAKKVYFGVGGSMDGFVEEAQKLGMICRNVEFMCGEVGGVRRCVQEVRGENIG
ncbi:hypothetical protein EJ05DRAFT_510546 [Pseudovirgaria hyperparasitica]|uniref:protein-histidine N-methyltransferase n=1 Tax=Pseudovirgaria hyperparasitica TaxID=470096 RepID=A0A6A6W9U0_9PEZI|nr:uncharacterized protein EJ05DRAFT_510546 [Pseudovirgaria hyperparasitica]KAF2758646.1 hypothetical protein EJ05DRAFT_510546 [Pseudovirgaria hyperparasitica]